MADGNPETAEEPEPRTPLEERVSADKRQFLKLVLGSMTAYSVPLMASFSMGGLRFGSARAQQDTIRYEPDLCPPGLGAHRSDNPPPPFNINEEERPGRPFSDPAFQPNGRAFDTSDCLFSVPNQSFELP